MSMTAIPEFSDGHTCEQSTPTTGSKGALGHATAFEFCHTGEDIAKKALFMSIFYFCNVVDFGITRMWDAPTPTLWSQVDGLKPPFPSYDMLGPVGCDAQHSMTIILTTV